MCIKLQIQLRGKESLNSENHDSRKAQLIEYQAAQEFALQADTVAWQISSILISAVVIAIGYLVTLEDKKSSFLLAYF